MKLKGHDRVCSATSRRARVLPTDEEEVMPVTNHPRSPGYTMLGRTRCDDPMMGFIKMVQDDHPDVRFEQHTHNRLLVSRPGVPGVVVSSTLQNDAAFDELHKRLTTGGILMMPKNEDEEIQVLTGTMALSKALGGIPFSEGSSYLLLQFMESMSADLDAEVTRRLQSAQSETLELLSVAERERDEAKEQQRRETLELVRQRDEARRRAETAEKELATILKAVRGVTVVDS
jgi:hypothetical protein